MLEKIEATLTFKDGQTVQILLAPDADSAWGNREEVLWRSVPIREAIVSSMWDESLWSDNEDDEDIIEAMVEAIEADRAQRPTISHAEAQELHEIIGGFVRGLDNGREYVTAQEARRALEIAALVVSDTEGE